MICLNSVKLCFIAVRVNNIGLSVLTMEAASKHVAANSNIMYRTVHWLVLMDVCEQQLTLCGHSFGSLPAVWKDPRDTPYCASKCDSVSLQFFLRDAQFHLIFPSLLFVISNRHPLLRITVSSAYKDILTRKFSPKITASGWRVFVWLD